MCASIPNSFAFRGPDVHSSVHSPALGLLLLALFLCGCTIRNSRKITGSGDLASTPAGPTAVLRVTAVARSDPRTGQTTWGLINTPNIEDRFAEFLASAAARDDGLTVIDPYEVQKRLRAAHLKPTLQPDDQQLQQFAKALGLASYLVAHVNKSRLEYRFIWSWADADYTVACYVPGRAQPLWQAHVCRAAPGKTDREVLALSLKEMFDWLRGRQLAPDGAECPP